VKLLDIVITVIITIAITIIAPESEYFLSDHNQTHQTNAAREQQIARTPLSFNINHVVAW
jgi:hypothetical protein